MPTSNTKRLVRCCCQLAEQYGGAGRESEALQLLLGTAQWPLTEEQSRVQLASGNRLTLTARICPSTSHSHSHIHSLSFVLVAVMKPKELKAKTSHAHSLILTHSLPHWLAASPARCLTHSLPHHASLTQCNHCASNQQAISWWHPLLAMLTTHCSLITALCSPTDCLTCSVSAVHLPILCVCPDE